MTRTISLAVTMAISAASAPAAAASPFDGLWVDALKTQVGEAGFDAYVVADDRYTCSSCSPPRSYPTDGRMRPVPGDPSVIGESVTIAGPRRIVTRIASRQMTRVTTMTVAADDRTATYVSIDRWPGSAKALRTVYLAKRVTPAPAAAHPVSGSWRGVAYTEVPEEYRSVRLTEIHGRFTRSNVRRGHYTARIGGPGAPVHGDGQNIYRAVVRAPNARTRVETILLKQQPVVERTYRVSADGRSMTTSVRDPKDGQTFTTVSHRKRG